MTKAKFAITVYADTLVGAEALAEQEIASFLGIDSDKVADSLEMEFLVTTPDSDDEKRPAGKFEVVVYASIKRNAAVNFGTH